MVTGKKQKRRGWAPISKNKKCQPGAWNHMGDGGPLSSLYHEWKLVRSALDGWMDGHGYCYYYYYY